MSDLDPGLPWLDPAWRADADAWIAVRLAELRIEQIGPSELIRARPWGAVIRVPTTDGLAFFKQPLAIGGFEIGLTPVLAGWCPDATPPVLAADAAGGRLLLADAGVLLDTVEDRTAYLDHWHRALAICAQVQIAGFGQTDLLLALGVPDRRLTALPDLYRALLDGAEDMLRDRPGALTPAEYARLRALAPALRGRCERLAALGIPETIQHNDLHERNVLVRDGRVTLADWGDACVAHPFQMLGETLRRIAGRLRLPKADPALAALRDTYLRPFRGMAGDEDLRAAVRLAAPLGLLCGVLTDHVIAANVEPAFRGDLLDEEVERLRRFTLD